MFRFRLCYQPYLNQGTITTYLGEGAKLLCTLKNLKYVYIPMKLTQNEVINMNFWTQSKKLFLLPLTLLWRQNDAIIM